MKMKKVLAMLLAVVMIVVVSVAGTIAWLMDTTDEVVNTFTVGNIDISLTETFNVKSEEGLENPDKWENKLIPGESYPKDPTITVDANSEACYLFVKITEAGGEGTVNADSATKTAVTFKDYISYKVRTTGDQKWTALEDGVYYIEVATSAEDQKFYVLTGDNENENGIVTIPNTVTKDMLDAIGTEDGDIVAPTLSFKAYAVQKANIEATGNKTAVQIAWETVSGASN